MIRTYIKSFPKYGAVVAILIEWLALVGFYTLNPSYFGSKYPVSYFATLPQTRLVFSVCYTLAAVSFWIFVRYHLSSRYVTPTKIFSLSMLGFAAVAIFPFSFDDVISSAIHNLLTLFFALTFIAGICLMARHNPDRQLRIVSIVAVMAIAVLISAFLLVPKDSSFVFMLEVGSGFACQFWMIWMSFHAFSKKEASTVPGR